MDVTVSAGYLGLAAGALALAFAYYFFGRVAAMTPARRKCKTSPTRSRKARWRFSGVSTRACPFSSF